MRDIVLAAALMLSAGPALAESHATGDPAAGEKAFRQCQTCHVVRDDEGNVLAGRSARIGPNLFRLAGRQAGTADFRYGDDLVKAGEAGLVWDEAGFVPYVLDPTGFLREVLSDPGARSKMAFKLRDEQLARDVWAFLASLSPDVTN